MNWRQFMRRRKRTEQMTDGIERRRKKFKTDTQKCGDRYWIRFSMVSSVCICRLVYKGHNQDVRNVIQRRILWLFSSFQPLKQEKKLKFASSTKHSIRKMRFDFSWNVKWSFSPKKWVATIVLFEKFSGRK